MALLVVFQGVKNKDCVSDEVIEAFKYTFGQPGAMTPPINYYRNLFKETEEKGSSGGFKPIELPTLIIWVRPLPCNVHVFTGVGTLL